MGGAVSALAAALANRTPALIGRVAGEQLVLDLRAVLPRQDLELVAAFEALAPTKGEPAPLPDPIT